MGEIPLQLTGRNQYTHNAGGVTITTDTHPVSAKKHSLLEGKKDGAKPLSWLLGAQKDTLPRRKWFRLLGSSLAASFLASKVKSQSAQSVSGGVVGIEGAGAPESWGGSLPLSPFSLVNLSTGNLFTSIPLLSFSGRGLNVSLTFFHNSSAASSLQPFGYGFTHSYFWRLQQDNYGNALVLQGTGRKHKYTYDPETGKFLPLIQVQEASGKVLRFGYAESGSGSDFGEGGTMVGSSVDTKIRTVTDPRGKVWQFNYDADGNLISITDPMGYRLEFGYNEMGWRVYRKDGLGRITHYAYDDLGRLSSVTGKFWV